MEYISKRAYEEKIAVTRDARMDWWREARFGMFVHYGLYAILGRMEWAMRLENTSIEEYERLADEFAPKPDAPREWVRLAKNAGCRYMVLTTRHHDGFALWDSAANPFNSVRYGPHRDIVREYVDACREYGMRIGFYFSLMDWHDIDCWNCPRDSAARKRVHDRLKALITELMTQYGKIDILWYDGNGTMDTWEGWNSLELNQLVRSLQPDIIINNRAHLDEDFGTPEGSIRSEGRDWEACMTWNDLSWGYVDSKQAAPYGYNAQRILKMLYNVTKDKGNLLLNIGPAPDGSVPEEAFEPLRTVGKWLEANGEAVYGKVDKSTPFFWVRGTTRKKKTLYVWNWIWPDNGQFTMGGFQTRLLSASLMDGTALSFEQDEFCLTIRGLPKASPDKLCNVSIVKLEFEAEPAHKTGTRYPATIGSANPQK